MLIDGTELGLELSTAHHSTSVGDSASKSNNSAQYSSVGSILELLQVP